MNKFKLKFNGGGYGVMGKLVLGNEMYACTVWITVLMRHQMNATSYMSPRAGLAGLDKATVALLSTGIARNGH